MGKRGRKSQYINKITSKDEWMLKAFRACGYIKESQLRNDLEIAKTRIKNFVRDGYFEKAHYLNVKTHETFDVYRLSDRGRKLCSEQLNLSNFYKSSSAEHDLHVADHYFACTAVERDSWQTEADLRDELYERYPDQLDQLQQEIEDGKLSSVDAVYTSEAGETIGVEIVTKNYNEAEIEAKQEFAKRLDISLELVRV